MKFYIGGFLLVYFVALGVVVKANEPTPAPVASSKQPSCQVIYYSEEDGSRVGRCA